MSVTVMAALACYADRRLLEPVRGTGDFIIDQMRLAPVLQGAILMDRIREFIEDDQRSFRYLCIELGETEQGRRIEVRIHVQNEPRSLRQSLRQERQEGRLKHSGHESAA